MTDATNIETIRAAKRKRGFMDARQAAQVNPGDRLEHPEGWPKMGPQALAEPVEVFGARDCPFSETGRILYFHSADGKRTLELDAGWFKPPKRIAETGGIVSCDPKPKSEWDF